MTVSTEWANFAKLVEAALRVEKILAEGKINKRGSRVGQAFSTSREQSRQSEERRFVLRVSGKGKFKAQSSGSYFAASPQGGDSRKSQGRFPQTSAPTGGV